MTDDAAFLAAILAEPADDTLRLVYADYLEEHDDPVRAAVVRAGVAHPDKELNVFRRALVSRREIWEFNGPGELFVPKMMPRLREELPAPADVPWLLRLTYRRGFVDCVRLTWFDWCQQCDVRKVWPLSRVDLTTEPDLDAQWDGRDKMWWDVIAGEIAEVPADRMPRDQTGGNLTLLSARWPGLTFTSPGSRRAGG